jgi:hypothetical protein
MLLLQLLLLRRLAYSWLRFYQHYLYCIICCILVIIIIPPIETSGC